jgi:protein TonB
LKHFVELPPPPSNGPPPKVDPTAYHGELVVPAHDDQRVRDTLVATIAPSTPIGVSIGDHVGNPSNTATPGSVGGFDPDPPMDKYVYVETLPDLVKQVTPEYPSIARQAGMSGKVLLALQVGTDGRVRRVQILESSVMFDSAAVQAARQWVYTPATSDGHPVVVWVRQAVSFVLRD